MVMYYFEAEKYGGEKLIYIFSTRKEAIVNNKYSKNLNFNTSDIKKLDHITILNGEIYGGF